MDILPILWPYSITNLVAQCVNFTGLVSKLHTLPTEHTDNLLHLDLWLRLNLMLCHERNVVKMWAR